MVPPALGTEPARTIVDVSHSGERTTLEAIELSLTAPIPAQPRQSRLGARDGTQQAASGTASKALRGSGGILGLSLYPHHLPDGSDNAVPRLPANMAAEAGPGRRRKPARHRLGPMPGPQVMLARWMVMPAAPPPRPAIPWFFHRRQLGSTQQGFRRDSRGAARGRISRRRCCGVDGG